MYSLVILRVNSAYSVKCAGALVFFYDTIVAYTLNIPVFHVYLQAPCIPVARRWVWTKPPHMKTNLEILMEVKTCMVGGNAANNVGTMAKRPNATYTWVLRKGEGC